MEEEFKELISLLENKLQPEAESSFNIKGAAIVALMTVIFGFLFVGWAVNTADIGRLQENLRNNTEIVRDFKTNQEKIMNLVIDIRLDQQRRQGKEK
jgi:hypothetical protein